MNKNIIEVHMCIQQASEVTRKLDPFECCSDSEYRELIERLTSIVERLNAFAVSSPRAKRAVEQFSMVLDMENGDLFIHS